MSSPAISIRGLSFRYPGGQDILENIDLDVAAGEYLGIIGPNGSGKSTLLKLIVGLLEPTGGSIEIHGQKPRRGGQRTLGYVPQSSVVPPRFPISVRDAVSMGRIGLSSWLFGYSAADMAAVDEQLALLGLDQFADAPFEELSGGQRQRALIARALVSDPSVIIFDEPTASVDPHAEENIFKLLGEKAKSKTIIIVSHDIGFISSQVRRVACLNRTLVCHETAHLTPELMDQLYGHHVHAIPHRHD